MMMNAAQPESDLFEYMIIYYLGDFFMLARLAASIREGKHPKQRKYWLLLTLVIIIIGCVIFFKDEKDREVIASIIGVLAAIILILVYVYT